MKKTEFCRCSVRGTGKILGDNSQCTNFQIIDLSAEGATIFLLNEIEIDTQAKIVIVLPAILFQVEIKSDAKIVQKNKAENGFEYYLEFIGLPERDKLEIDELMRSTCNMDCLT